MSNSYPRSVWPDVRRKSSQNFETLAQKLAKEAFNHKVMFFKIVHKVTKYLDYFCKKICCNELSKIAQSGHTGNRALCFSAISVQNLMDISDYTLSKFNVF